MGEIAGDTKTLSINVLDSELAALKLARSRRGFKTVSELVRAALVRDAEIEDPELAAQLKEARLKRFATNTAVVLVGFTAVIQTTFGFAERYRKAGRMVRPSIRQAIRRQDLIEA